MARRNGGVWRLLAAQRSTHEKAAIRRAEGRISASRKLLTAHLGAASGAALAHALRCGNGEMAKGET
jgi:hypothetical protein